MNMQCIFHKFSGQLGARLNYLLYMTAWRPLEPNLVVMVAGNGQIGSQTMVPTGILPTAMIASIGLTLLAKNVDMLPSMLEL